MFLTFINVYAQGNVNYYKTENFMFKLCDGTIENTQKQCNREATFTSFSTIC